MIEYDDGSRQVFSTDESWQVSTSGAYTVAGLYEGVCFDARKSISDIPWKNADKADWKYHPGIRPTYGVLAHRQEILKPVEMHPSKRGGTIYDFGQNCSAVICLDIKNAKAGQQILVRHAEILLDGELFTSNLRKAEATVHYICRDGRQFFTPELTTMGFRYVRVQGIEPEDLTITAQVVSSLDAPTGGFACSNERLNQLQSNIQWGARSNFVDIPTDCPQRDERMGWTGDIAVFAEESPLVVPCGQYPLPVLATAGWGDCASLVPWAQYMKNGDTGLIERQYESVQKLLGAETFWSGFLHFGKKRHIWKWPVQLGDWLSPGEDLKQWMGKGPWIATAYYYHTADIASKMAERLNKPEDVSKYQALMKQIEDSFRSVFTDGDGKLFREFQSAYICPIHFGMLSEAERMKMGDHLDELVKQNDYKINTGFLGTPYLLFALSDTGHVETAYKVLLNEECPGWLYAVKTGATTIWERWDALLPDGTVNLTNDLESEATATSADQDIEDQNAQSMTSFNHYAYGAVGDWLYRRVAGLEALEPGWKRFRVKPVLGGGLTWAEAYTQTPLGTARVHWKFEADLFEATIEVPSGASCEVVLPNGERQILSEGQHHITCHA